jgi:hypothetical protein
VNSPLSKNYKILVEKNNSSPNMKLIVPHAQEVVKYLLIGKGRVV